MTRSISIDPPAPRREGWKTLLRAVLVTGALSAVLATTAARAGEGSIHGVLSAMATCQGCHVAGAPDAGGLNPEPTDGNEVLGTWPQSLVNVPPTNAAARDAGKLRVHAYVPWNSFLLDKLTGDLKEGEGEAMRGSLHPAGAGTGEPAEIHRCPGIVDELSNWILAGAPGAPAIVPGDFDWPWINCARPQQPIGSLAAPLSGHQVVVEPFAVDRPDREAARNLENVTVGNAGEAWVNRIEILASAGTEYLAVRRSPDEAPLAVARGPRNPAVPHFRWDGNPGNQYGWVPGDERVRLTVELPPGVAVRLDAGQTLAIEHRIRNDYWISDASSEADYANHTTGEAILNFHTIAAGEVVSEASPILESTGTDLLAAPADALGATGGAWAGTFEGALLGLWTDQRAVAASIAAPAAASAHARAGILRAGGDVERGYATFAASVPGQAVAYSCVHSNGLHDSRFPAEARPGSSITTVSRPVRYGCVPAAGAGSEPPEICYRAGDCGADATCEPVTLSGGDGVHDGRCTLVGLVW